jgi:hypothetical protein
MSQIARETSLSPESLYKALDVDGNLRIASPALLRRLRSRNGGSTFPHELDLAR